MKKRVISAIFILLILFTFFGLRLLELSVFDFMLLGINLIGVYEVSDCNTKTGRHNYLYVALFFVIYTYLGLTICFAYEMNILYSFVLILVGLPISVLLMFILSGIQSEQVRNEYNMLTENMSEDEKPSFRAYQKGRYITTLKVLMYPGLLLTTMYYLNNISRLNFVSLNGYADLGWFLIMSMFSISMATDTFAFLTGILFKGMKLAPKISPNKTISGAIGGLVAGVMAEVALYLIFNSFEPYRLLFSGINLGISHVAMIGMLGSIMNQLGDLYESYEKRRLGIKDFGNIFPGHGGIMDRVDGQSFVSATLFVIYIIALA